MVRERAQADPTAVANFIRQLLERTRNGEIDASPTELARMEGAIVALEIIAGGDPGDVAAALITGT